MKNQFIVNEIRLTYHKNELLDFSHFKSVNSSHKLCKAFRQIWNIDEIEIRESFYAIYLNSRLNAVGYRKISDGGIDAVVVDMRLLISPALLSNAKFIAVAHNHPTGLLIASQSDKMLTKQINQACELMQMKLIDHIILTDKSYYSFADAGEV